MLTTPSLINQPQISPRVSTANYDVETNAVFWGSVLYSGGRTRRASIFDGGRGGSGTQPQHLLARVKVWGSTEALSDIIKDLLSPSEEGTEVGFGFSPAENRPHLSSPSLFMMAELGGVV